MISGMSEVDELDVKMKLTSIRRSQLAGFFLDVVELVWGELDTSEKNKLLKFLKKLFYTANFKEVIVLLAICYILKLNLNCDGGDLRSIFLNCELFIISALLISYKYLEDEPFVNKVCKSLTYSSLQTIMKTEWLFMEKLDYKIHMTKEEFDKFVMYFKNKFNFPAQMKENPIVVCRPPTPSVKNRRSQQPKGSNNSFFAMDPSRFLLGVAKFQNKGSNDSFLLLNRADSS
ncbi:10614_t:CDS:2 [Ambispora gerdemannii]|uniref:10614_t:CDS:1 n=1 Tax=Ambispora gerdemannii TaxID=144530 RepID=A0A9N9CAA0_9GLOM|nr:10614_t:CDS:2 [Ambispora gerdemannii]